MSRSRLIPYAAMTAAGLVAATGAANAQSMYDINQRQDYQQNRIERGVRDGQLTRSEAAGLEQGERRIDFAQAQAEADGHVSRDERARIERMTNRENRAIYQESHNGQQSWDRGQQWGRTDGRNDGWRDLEGRARGETMRDINQRQNYQQDRIERGVRDGQITRSEAARLEQGERRIDYAQARAEADGRVTGQERARIERMTNQENRAIYQSSHNGQQSWDRGQQWGRTDGRNDGWHDLEGKGRMGGNGGGWNRGGDNVASNGGWNHGGNGGWGNGGWNRGGNSGGPFTGPGTGPATGGGRGPFNGPGTGPATSGGGGPFTGPGTGPATGGGAHGWGGGGGWNRGGSAGPATPAPGGTAVASNSGGHGWGGQTRPVSAPIMGAPTGGTPAAVGVGRGAGGGGRHH